MNHSEKVVSKLALARKAIKDIGKWRQRFQALRLKHGVSIAAFCRQHAINNTALCHIMAGRRGAGLAFVERVSKKLREAGV